MLNNISNGVELTQDFTASKETANKSKVSTEIRVIFAPATVANVVCGFDVLGFAVNST